MRTVTCFILLGLVSAGSLDAQMHRQQGQGQGQARGGGMGAMMMMGPLADFLPFAPASLLEHADRLALSPDQIERLTALEKSAEQRLEHAHAPAQAAMQGVDRELEAEIPDTASVRQLLAAHMTAMGNMQWVRLQAALEARAILTPEQRTLVEETTAEAPGSMQHRHRSGQQR
jgi:Spy/CpxP family protein refolding chaperone